MLKTERIPQCYGASIAYVPLKKYAPRIIKVSHKGLTGCLVRTNLSHRRAMVILCLVLVDRCELCRYPFHCASTLSAISASMTLKHHCCTQSVQWMASSLYIGQIHPEYMEVS